jgi:predicted acylesterase/phospholipase RssA
VLGYTLDEIERLSIEFDFSVLRTIEPDSMFMFPVTFGLDPGNSIERLIHSVLRQKGFGADTTFRDLADRYPISLRCYATELQTSKVREFSVKASPHTKIVFAIHASMALPVLYTPVKDPDSPILLVDGGILHNLPLVFLNEEETAETIGILFTGGETQGESQDQVQEPTIIDVCRYIYNTVNVMRTLPYIEKYKENLITINLGSQTAFNFEETPASRAGLIEAAMKQANTFIYGFRFSRPARRFSAC